MKLPKHPAKYSDVLLPTLAALLDGSHYILDPFGGVGKVGELRKYGVPPEVHITTVEIEPEWGAFPAEGVDVRVVGDATAMPFGDGSFDAVVTSPTYGNRFADHHKAKDSSTRRGYTHDLRTLTGDEERTLHPNNTGAMHWGSEYRRVHLEAWKEVHRVLQPGGVFVLNVSDFLVLGEAQPVTEWHLTVLETLGFIVVSHRMDIVTPRMRFGANREKRVAAESVIMLWRMPDPLQAEPVPAAVRAIARCAHAETEADELERAAVRYMRERGMDEYREALRAREYAQRGLDFAWQAGFERAHFDAFEQYSDSPATWKKLKTPKRWQHVLPSGDASDILASVASGLEDMHLYVLSEDTHDAEEALHDLIAPWLGPPPAIEDFAVAGDEWYNGMLRDSFDLRDRARLERLLS